MSKFSVLALARYWLPCALLLILSFSASGNPLTPGSVFLSFTGSDFIGEYSRNGALLQSIRVPYPGPVNPGTESVRDLQLTRDGTLAIYNGTFAPYLTIWNPVSNSFTNDTLSGWSSDGNLSFGAIATFKNFVFATDNINFNDLTVGVVRFDRSSPGNAQRFTTINPLDLAIGRDGLLYVLGAGIVFGPTGATAPVEVFDPTTMSLLRTVFLQHQVSSITANSQGNIVGASNTGGLIEFDQLGQIISTVPGIGVSDLEISPDGTILGRGLFPFEGAFLADLSLHGASLFEQTGATFVAFGPSAQVSEPSTGILALFGILGLLAGRCRRLSWRNT